MLRVSTESATGTPAWEQTATGGTPDEGAEPSVLISLRCQEAVV